MRGAIMNSKKDPISQEDLEFLNKELNGLYAERIAIRKLLATNGVYNFSGKIEIKSHDGKDNIEFSINNQQARDILDDQISNLDKLIRNQRYVIRQYSDDNSL